MLLVPCAFVGTEWFLPLQLRGEALYRMGDYKMALTHFREGIKCVNTSTFSPPIFALMFILSFSACCSSNLGALQAFSCDFWSS